MILSHSRSGVELKSVFEKQEHHVMRPRPGACWELGRTAFEISLGSKEQANQSKQDYAGGFYNVHKEKECQRTSPAWRTNIGEVENHERALILLSRWNPLLNESPGGTDSSSELRSLVVAIRLGHMHALPSYNANTRRMREANDGTVDLL